MISEPEFIDGLSREPNAAKFKSFPCACAGSPPDVDTSMCWCALQIAARDLAMSRSPNEVRPR